MHIQSAICSCESNHGEFRLCRDLRVWCMSACPSPTRGDRLWLQGVFREAGVTTRMTVIPEPVDVRFFDPVAVIPLPLPLGRLVFGQSRPPQQPTFHFLSVSCRDHRLGKDSTM